MVSTRGFGVAVSERIVNWQGHVTSKGQSGLANCSTVHVPFATHIHKVFVAMAQSTVASHRPADGSVIAVWAKNAPSSSGAGSEKFPCWSNRGAETCVDETGFPPDSPPPHDTTDRDAHSKQANDQQLTLARFIAPSVLISHVQTTVYEYQRTAGLDRTACRGSRMWRGESSALDRDRSLDLESLRSSPLRGQGTVVTGAIQDWTSTSRASVGQRIGREGIDFSS